MTRSTRGSSGASSVRSRIGLGTGWGRGAIGGGAAPTATPGELHATKFINAQAFHGGSIPRTITTEKFVNEQLFYSLATLAAPVMAIGDGALQSAAVEPINAGLVFCLGSHPTGSALLGKDLVSGNAGTLLASGNLAGTNASHGTWRCLDSTSLTNGGAHFPSTSQLRSITTQRTFAFHGTIDAFGTWSALISIPYAAGTWVQPWMSHAFRRQSSTGANLNVNVATGGTGYASVSSSGGFTTGERWFAVAIDGAEGVARFYVDGFQVGGDVGISTAPVDWGANQPVVIFNRSNSSLGEGTDGRCYTAAIWNRVLSQNELAQLVISPQRMFASGGPVSLIATKFVNTQTFGSHTLIGAGTIQLTATKFVETQLFRSHIITQAPPPGGETVGPLEPTDGSALGVAISVGTSPRQTWIGYGWGFGGSSQASANLPALTTHVTKLCEEMGAKVARMFTPEASDFVSKYLGTWNLIKNHGIDVIFTSSFVYRTTHGAGGNTYDINGMADGIHAAISGGINPSHLFACTIQNEPDGHPDNHIPPGGLSVVRSHQETLRSRLNTLGRASVRVIGLEWRHPQALSSEFDDYNANDIIPGTVADGCMHYYDDGLTQSYYDNRWMTKGRGIWSTETGDNNSPKTQAQFIAGLNHGKVVEIAHVGLGGYNTSNPNQHQLLVTTGGERTQWWYACAEISKTLQRGVVFRKCLSSDRPTDPTMPTTQASEMIWDSSTNPCGPRQLVGCGRRTDGRWVLVALNYAFDTKVETSYSGGHYGAITQQLTVTIPELSTVDRVWSGRRASRTGSTTNVTVNMRAGIMRFTLAPAETIALTMNAT